MLHVLLLAAAMHWALPLDGPWKFHVGDDARWASPVFNDASWVTQSLEAPADANDGDQGITHFAPGWAAQGFSGYQGFAWYRIHVNEPALADGELAILGPAMADSAYQIYVDGRLVGGIGTFTGTAPVAYAIHPALFAIHDVHEPLLVAVRVWMGPWASGPQSGGMHVAPIIGNVAGVQDAYAVQWFEKIRAFSLEIAQLCWFVLLAIVALLLVLSQANKRGSVALAVALLLTAAERAHLTVLWCLSVETIPTFFIVSTLLVPATLGAWLLAWTYWLDIQKPRLIAAIVALTAVYAVTGFLRQPTLNGGILPGLAVITAKLSPFERYLFLAVLLFIIYTGIREFRRETLTALPAIVLIGIGQFGPELARLGVPGIWFPFGMGVSLTNYAYLLSNVAIFGLLWRKAVASRPASIYSIAL